MPRVIYSTNGKHSRIPNGSYMEHVFAEHITILCSYLMGVQAIYQNIFLEVPGKTKLFYCPRSTTECNKTLWSFQIPRETLFDLLLVLPLHNCFITYL